MIDIPPPIQILLALAGRGRAADYTQAGVNAAVTIRHARNRKPVRSEKPAGTLILVSDDAVPDDLQRNDFEIAREMVVDLQVDLDLATEDSGEDETGLLVLMRFAAVFVAAARDPGVATWLGGMVDWISLGALEPDDRSTPDDGRMTRALTVLYRVRSDDENVLLWQGVNG